MDETGIAKGKAARLKGGGFSLPANHLRSLKNCPKTCAVVVTMVKLAVEGAAMVPTAEVEAERVVRLLEKYAVENSVLEVEEWV
jgi:hypothetical protein